MKLIFIGLIFIMLELNIGINLLPDFVGYLLIFKACGDWAKESKKMAAVRPVALVMAGVTGVIFVMNILKLTSDLGVIGTVIEIGMVLGTLLAVYMLGQGIREIEAQNGVELNGQAILNSWKLLAIAEIAGYTMILLGKMVSVLNLIGLVLVLAAFLFKVVLLVSAYFSNKMYKEWKNPVVEE